MEDNTPSLVSFRERPLLVGAYAVILSVGLFLIGLALFRLAALFGDAAIPGPTTEAWKLLTLGLLVLDVAGLAVPYYFRQGLLQRWCAISPRLVMLYVAAALVLWLLNLLPVLILGPAPIYFY